MTQNAQSKGNLILVVDDDPDKRGLLRYNLLHEGFKVAEASNGKEALDLFKEEFPDLILLDAVMPVMDGFETCRALRALPGGQTVPILMTSSLVDDSSIEKAYASGITEFVTKPIQWSLLRHRIHQLLKERALNALRPVIAALSDAPNPRDLVGLTAKLDKDFFKRATIHNQQLIDQLRLKRDLHTAVQNNELELHYQPQIDFFSGKTVGVEALLRWNHPDLGLIGPDRFIGIAEETGIITKIGDWILWKACQDCKRWQKYDYPAIKVAVNVSPKQLEEPDFITKVQTVLKTTGLEPKYLELEITEGQHIKDIKASYALLSTLREIGIEIAVDDFGTGYSSLSYLQQLPVDVLKIDAYFVRSLGDNQKESRYSEKPF